MTSTERRLGALLALTLSVSCAETRTPPVPANPEGGAGAGGTASGGVAGSGTTAGGGAGGLAPSCDRCGGAQTGCTELLVGCSNDATCAALMTCVYQTRRCTLDVGGAACLRACVEEACAAPEAVVRFLEADRCVYCTSSCREVCAGYCAAVSHDQLGCGPGGAASR